jgi:hypothetical protein
VSVDTNEQGGLVKLGQAERMLAEISSAQDAINVIDLASAARVWAQRAKLGTASINHAQSIKLKAEIKLADAVDAGQLAKEIEQAGGDRKSQIILTRDNNDLAPKSLADVMGLEGEKADGLAAKKLHDARKIRGAYTPEAIDEIVELATLEDREVTHKDFVQGRAHVSQNSGENEWYTPVEFIAAARAAMGSIDVDPASNDQAQLWIQADAYFTKERSGLNSPWVGNVWMNPPYSQPLIGQFCEKACDEYEWGASTQAVVLVNNGTETRWGQRLLETCSAICFPAGRIRFIDQNGEPSGAPLQGQMIVYLGDAPARFEAAFTQFGVVLNGW